ncbi:DUF7574 domain-containing protein [Arthrobacter sp. B2a2-09]|uniref:DUF7574 domain-containing protein n=1 Tax=Arthrobacter sp. B2a2-09 TaxID=2952822 RepID=UPI0022CD77E3|nr:hypothetical protein [Arthrobacter sp. B2a2-09]MCZ9884626.1 hypothetical protein [Arthrobacter sp. B2a2-09]
MRLHALIESEGLVPVASLHAGGWEWGAIAVYYKPDARRFFWLSESGCSCTYFGDGSSYALGDFQDGDRQAAIEALKGFSHWDDTPGRDDVEREATNVRNYKYEEISK